jgi:lysophospholipase L1-like esterase
MNHVAWILSLLLASPLFAEVPKFSLADGDRIVFVGATMVERDAQHGYFETLLNAQFPTARFTFRNLGWSGDTVWGESRAEFGSPKDGYARLVQEVTEAKPTVLLICYGANESFEGEAGLSHFIEQYDRLLTDLAKTGAKTWLIGPTRHEDLPRPLPDPTAHNKQLKQYDQAICELAARRGYGFVELFEALPDGTKESPPRALTDNGLHYNAYGAWRFARAMLAGLIPGAAPRIAGNDEAKQLEALRLKTIAKNREHFYRWRPQNDTYIFGFRKQEQGRNAVEIPQFDPIVQKLEAEIVELKRTLKPGVVMPAPDERAMTKSETRNPNQ